MIVVREVRYQADGLALVGTLAIPEGEGPFPGVLIAHEGPGLDDIQRHRASDIAELGYVGFALDYHGGLSPFAARESMMERLGELRTDPDRTRALGLAGLEVLCNEPSVDSTRIAAIGYCFGATVALEVGRSGADVRAIVGFHPGLTNIRPDDSRNITGRVLMCIGTDDPIVPLEHRVEFEAEMRNAGVRYDIHLYGGVQHSFTHPYASLAGVPGVAFDERAAVSSWNSMRDLFTEVF
jgi:dienelactone hydrolase